MYPFLKVLGLIFTALSCAQCFKTSSISHIHTKTIEKDRFGTDGCKLTYLGTDYAGKLDRTTSGKLCKHWIHAIYDNENEKKDAASAVLNNSMSLPDGSWKAARNYCRNPDADKNGPWCYVLAEGAPQRETCDVPLCRQTNGCRLSGIGQEMHEGISKSAFGQTCQDWKDAPLNGTNFCANPSESPSGPWCFVSSGERQPCDIPICNLSRCASVQTPEEEANFLHFVALGGKRNLHFRFKSWDASTLKMQQGAKILLSTIPHMEGNEGFLVEVKPEKFGGGLIVSKWPPPLLQEKEENSRFEHSHSANVSGTRWGEVSIELSEDKISVGKTGDFLTVDTPTENIRFFALGGLMALWNTDETDACCEEHVTTSMNFSRLWPLIGEEHEFVAEFSIRAFHSPAVMLNFGPGSNWGYYLVIFDQNLSDKLLWVDENSVQSVRAKKKKEFPLFQDFRKWQTIKISVFGDELKVVWHAANKVNSTILSVKDPKVSGLRWFSIGSDKTLAHWLINCKPKDWVSEVLEVQDHCLRDPVGFNYKGWQGASSRGWPCLPWTHPRVDQALQVQHLFPDGSLEGASNFCRNPNWQPGGPWCYTLQPGFPPKSCAIRECSAETCRNAGTGNDYMGTLSTTIGNRTCQKWTDMHPHVIDWELLKEDKFPDLSAENASNFCRNPSRDIIGSYCFTTDPLIRYDACYVPSCRLDVEATQSLILKGFPKNGHELFIPPSWRHGDGLQFSVKQWDPVGNDGLKMTLRPYKGDAQIHIWLGAERNSLVKVTYNSTRTGEVLIFKRKVPHIIGVAEWSRFSVLVNVEKVELRLSDYQYPFLSWKSPNADFPLFSPVYLALGSESGNLLGVNFPSKDECFTFHEDVENGNYFEMWKHATMFFHMNQWVANSTLENHKRLSVYVRGLEKSSFAIAFSALGDLKSGYELVRFSTHTIEFGRVTSEGEMVSYHSQNYAEMVMPSLYFRHFLMRFSERKLEITSADAAIKFQHELTHGETLLWYIFTSASQGKVMWSVNCKPLDVDLVRDGGWSEWGQWQCGALCGGGRGFRTRTCTAPEPSLLGHFCEGPAKVSGACNQTPCGRVSFDSRRKIRQFLNAAANTFALKPGTTLNFTCEPPFLDTVLRQLYVHKQNVSLVWAKDGVLNLKDARNSTNFGLEKVNLDDSGVYTLQAVRKKDLNSAVPMCFFTLAVWRNVRIRAEEELTLDAHIGELALLYKVLVVRWIRGDVIFRRLALNPELQKHELKIQFVDKSAHGGEWRCEVLQPDLGLSWTTAWYHVEVLPALTFGVTLAEGPVLSIFFKPILDRFGEAMVVPVFTLTLVALFFMFCAVFKLYFRWEQRRRSPAPL